MTNVDDDNKDGNGTTEQRVTKLTMMVTMMTVAMGNDDNDGDGVTYPVRLRRATMTKTSMATTRRATKSTMMAMAQRAMTTTTTTDMTTMTMATGDR